MSIKNLKRLMYDLFYPAVLGSGLVSIAIRISAHNSTPDPYIFDRLSLGFLFLIFFCVSFIASDEGVYRCKAFLLDIAEVILMFLCFYCLGLFGQDNKEPWMAGAYATFIVLAPIQVLWRYVVGLDKWYLIELRVFMIVAFFFGLFFSDENVWITPVVSVASLLLICLYVFSPVWYLKFRSCK